MKSTFPRQRGDPVGISKERSGGRGVAVLSQYKQGGRVFEFGFIRRRQARIANALSDLRHAAGSTTVEGEFAGNGVAVGQNHARAVVASKTLNIAAKLRPALHARRGVRFRVHGKKPKPQLGEATKANAMPIHGANRKAALSQRADPFSADKKRKA